MANGFDEVFSEFSRLSDPEQQEAELQRRIDLASPQLQRFLRSTESRLNRMGLLSAAPLARATTQATSQFTGDISRSYFENLDQQRLGLLEIIAGIESEERARKSRERSSLFGGIGSFLGAGAGFLLGGPPGAVAGAGLGGSIGNISAPRFNYNPYIPGGG